MIRQKVFVFGGVATSLVNFRGPLLREMCQTGHEVTALAPQNTGDVATSLAAIGVRYLPVTLARAGLNPFADMLSFLSLKRIFRQERPDVLLSYTIKPVIYGSLAAKWTDVPSIFALITGLGASFYTKGVKGRLLRFIAVTMYRLALARCTRVLVQNEDIAELFIRESILPAEKIVVVPGSGVDTEHFAYCPNAKGPPVFLLLARMLWDKGVEEYVAAARLTKKQLPEARFLLVGDIDPNPSAICAEQLRRWNEEGVVEYRSAVLDVRPMLAACSVYVLPSYHEGMPRSVLEAMSTGRAVITTDTIGCRETVINAGQADAEGIRVGENGLLIPVQSVAPLAAAMIRLARDVGLRESMGRRGREIAEQQFDVHRINEMMLREMNLASRSHATPSPSAQHS